VNGGLNSYIDFYFVFVLYLNKYVSRRYHSVPIYLQVYFFSNILAQGRKGERENEMLAFKKHLLTITDLC